MNYVLILILFILLLIKSEVDMLNTNNKEVYGLLKIILSLELLSLLWIYLLVILLKNQRNDENQQKITDFYHNVRRKICEIN